MIGEDKDVIIEFVQLFVDTSVQTLAEMQNALSENDFINVGSLAHKLKSSIDLMGIECLKSDIRTIERFGKEKINTNELPGLIDRLSSVIKQVHVQMNEDFNLS